MAEVETSVQRHVRKERKGVVVSRSGDKTVVVVVQGRRRHHKYQKVVHFSKKFHVHDERNVAKTGDVVRIVECRPLSRMKRWLLEAVVESREAAGKVDAV